MGRTRLSGDSNSPSLARIQGDWLGATPGPHLAKRGSGERGLREERSEAWSLLKVTCREARCEDRGCGWAAAV